LEKSRSLKRHHRWGKIAIEASKQCGRGVIPKIESLQTYSEMLHAASTDHLRLILWEGDGIKLKEMLEGSKEKKKVFFIIGPEGGFSQDEVEKAERSGFVAVTLGRRILRAETASLCFLSILQYEWGDMG
jgi:16S rRNA (uracil1498-N3)-methyltransferase